MAGDTRENGNSSTTVEPRSSQATTKLPKGMVLGKDGKPCRTCTTLADFTSHSKKSTRAVTTTALPRDCPSDVEELGRSSWTLLHSISATYPELPSQTEQSQMKQFMGLFSKIYPCWVCAEEFQTYMERNKVRTESRESIGRWMCDAHNDVNKKLGKKEFDCDRWQERWKTGWKDGSCD